MKALAEQIVDIDGVEIFGRVVSVRGLMVEVAGPIHAMSVGARLAIETGVGELIPCEVVGFSDGHALAMPFAALEGVRRGCRAIVTSAAGSIRPSERWLGRVVNAMGVPIDGQGPLPPGPEPYTFRNSPPPAHARMRVGEPLDLGVRALNTFLTVCRGQRMGIFSGSGVGKSVLLSMLARNTEADVSVIGLVGFVWRELTAAKPIVDLRVLAKSRNLAVGAFLSFVLGFGLFASVFVFPIFTQRILGFPNVKI